MQILNFYNNSNIGLFFFTTDRITIVPSITPESVEDIIRKELKTKIIKTDLYSSSVDSIFISGNDRRLFVPDIIREEELEAIKKAGIPVTILNTKLNAVGNNMAVINDSILVNPKMEESAISALKKDGFNVKKGTIGGVGTVGANIVLFGPDRALVNPDTREKEIEALKSLGLKTIEKGTINGGGKIVKAGIIANKNGILISKETTGPEMLALERLWKNE